MKQTVYTASAESKQIHVLRLNNEGSLTIVQVVDMPGKVQPMVVSPDKRFLYVGVRQDHKFSVMAYYIASDDGILTLTAEATLPSSPTHISTDITGKYLFSSSYNGGCVSVTRLEDSIPIDTVDFVDGLEGCHFAHISLDNRTLWVLALKQDIIYLFPLSDEGKLKTPAEVTTVKGAGPRHLAFNPNQQYVYVVNELNSSVDVWKIYKQHSYQNKIECVQTLDIMPANLADTRRWAADIHITPNGNHLYASDRTSSLITIFSIYEDGSVLTIEGFQSTEIQPRSFNIDHSGKYLIAAGQKSNHLSIYQIRNNGLLEYKGRYPVGQGPMWVVVNAY